ncbi:MAG: hypothetical protein BJ554DRAFT_7059 [Olpidium bornovanus]|uniref:Uncharacterized protein n=1 Tax=Olpidium bornovanus TaxID=278681 RepID=A0A8H7ZWG2_9FUNG|nr:MAG: hypothetical protein BJ554DRAFT_7059 [Olpidium bornovanus]
MTNLLAYEGPHLGRGWPIQEASCPALDCVALAQENLKCVLTAELALRGFGFTRWQCPGIPTNAEAFRRMQQVLAGGPPIKPPMSLAKAESASADMCLRPGACLLRPSSHSSGPP